MKLTLCVENKKSTLFFILPKAALHPISTLSQTAIVKNGRIGPRSTGEVKMPKHHIFAMQFAKIYPLYVQKADAKVAQKKKLIKLSAG